MIRKTGLKRRRKPSSRLLVLLVLQGASLQRIVKSGRKLSPIYLGKYCHSMFKNSVGLKICSFLSPSVVTLIFIKTPDPESVCLKFRQ